MISYVFSQKRRLFEIDLEKDILYLAVSRERAVYVQHDQSNCWSVDFNELITIDRFVALSSIKDNLKENVDVFIDSTVITVSYQLFHSTKIIKLFFKSRFITKNN